VRRTSKLSRPPGPFVVPFAPAGGTDILARVLGQRLEQRLGKPFVVENRPGPAPSLPQFCRQSPPDGYTIMLSVSSLAIDATLYKTLPLRSAQGSGTGFADSPRYRSCSVVSPALPVHSVDELIKLAGQRPLSYGSGGIGAFHHLAAALFGQYGRHQAHPRTVSRHGAGARRSDGRLYPTHVQRSRPGLPLINAGKAARARGDVDEALSRALPNRAAARGGRRARFRRGAWQAVMAPAETPQPIVAKLNSELNAIVAMVTRAPGWRILG